MLQTIQNATLHSILNIRLKGKVKINKIREKTKIQNTRLSMLLRNLNSNM